MIVYDNHDMTNYHTFKCQVYAKFFCEVSTIEELKELLHTFKDEKKLVIGEGSNILFPDNYDGLIIKINLCNIRVETDFENKDDSFVYVTADSGLLWDKFVLDCVENGYYGLENLTAIPGTVGGATVQNIGAYGIEQSNFCIAIEVFNIKKNAIEIINAKDCHYGYRTSIFKNGNAATTEEYIILRTTYKLNKQFYPNLNYKDLMNLKYEISPKDLVSEIRKIRESKLPDYKIYGNAGSFYRNPIITEQKYKQLTIGINNLVSYPAGEGFKKVSAAQLIELSGMKGFKYKNASVSNQHSLVLVNNGSALPNEIVELDNEVRKAVFEKFGINLLPEVIII